MAFRRQWSRNGRAWLNKKRRRFAPSAAQSNINVVVTRTGVEVLQQLQPPNARITRNGIEVLQQGDPNIRVSKVGVEVLMVIGTTTTKFVSHLYEDYT